MLKQNKWKLLVTSLVTLLPALAGLLLWNRLPDQVAVHFNFNGQADGWSDKSFAVFALPLIFLGAHLFCILLTFVDPKKDNIGRQPIGLLFWLMPTVSLILSGALYAYSLGMRFHIGSICILLLGALYIVLGNIMPKVGQNYSFGIKVSWALDDPENWSHTHRVAGWSMVIGGLVLLAVAFWLNWWVILSTMLLSSLVPVVYSYAYYRRHGQKKS